jgi:hypothetical protein
MRRRSAALLALALLLPLPGLAGEVVVKPGDRLPVDGVVLEGASEVDAFLYDFDASFYEEDSEVWADLALLMTAEPVESLQPATAPAQPWNGLACAKARTSGICASQFLSFSFN